ncbi:hydroxymethylbilane synthase [candidate division LCP-89 bacterium B3_LCP]|uniref:Porphobilinogen deaminase n=1 Tax=candidate division LCP-89 bacterium B3_LCP TaxID=2012998 RepID=A0A532UPF6_UNCL8|nr:MAG: hydroxymethylbilane synthase [candidate division LCP-89 bacterium B3_LCP]
MADGQPLLVKVGARGSKLSLAQAGAVLEKLKAVSPEVQFELFPIKTQGDHDRQTPLAGFEGRGVFIKELESALSDGRIDIAVHSAKDMPSVLDEAYCIAAVPERAPVEDVLISKDNIELGSLPPGTKLATGSPRRRALVKMMAPAAEFVDVRGNIDTRLRKLHEGEFDAIILARAGLLRLGLEDHITQVLSPYEFIPASGQGALALEVRKDDNNIMEIARKIDSRMDHTALNAERVLLSTLQAGCSLPIGGWARWEDSSLKMDAVVLDIEGRNAIRSSGEVKSADDAEILGRRIAKNLISQGAKDLLRDGK